MGFSSDWEGLHLGIFWNQTPEALPRCCRDQGTIAENPLPTSVLVRLGVHYSPQCTALHCSGKLNKLQLYIFGIPPRKKHPNHYDTQTIVPKPKKWQQKNYQTKITQKKILKRPDDEDVCCIFSPSPAGTRGWSYKTFLNLSHIFCGMVKIVSYEPI